jgi:beta-N-acetylhexosaminidase
MTHLSKQNLNVDPLAIPLGPVMVDVEGLVLQSTEIERLRHPSVGAVILFARNYQNRDQLQKLVADIKSVRSPALLVAVDHEGGRVQRFVDEFTRLPAAREFGHLWDKDKHTAPMRAYESAYTMASELVEVGVDFSFAPVFDLTSKESVVIGDRCFHPDASAATELLGAYIDGIHAAGMVAIAKHFPGHGGVSDDSHHCLPSDQRSLEELHAHDLQPYVSLVDEIDGIMSAHVLFDRCDENIPTYSRFWLQTVLREEIGFKGVVFSDDLTMQGALDERGAKRAIVENAQRAIDAGCDMVLVCNRPDVVDALLNGLPYKPNEALSGRLSSLSARRQ